MPSKEQESIQQDNNNTSPPTERDKLLSELLAHINAERDAEALALFDGLDEADIIKKATSYLDIELFDTPLKIPLLGVAAYFGLLQLASRLLELGHRINKPIACTENPRLDKLSPLMLACGNNQIDVARLLINQQADLLAVKSEGNNLCIEIKSNEILELILESAQKQNKLEALLKHKNNQCKSAIEQFLSIKKPRLIKHFIELIGLEKLSNYADPSVLLSLLRARYFTNHQNAPAYEELCSRLRSLVPHSKVPPFKAQDSCWSPSFRRQLSRRTLRQTQSPKERLSANLCLISLPRSLSQVFTVS